MKQLQLKLENAANYISNNIMCHPNVAEMLGML
jgi:hypothetical protein